MLTKRNLVDVKKSTSKVQDPKKDLATRIKHLRVILENVDIAEAKGLFEANFSHIYNILYDSFVQTEANLRQRVHKAYKEELECTLWVLEQVLYLLPELIHRHWQLHSLGMLLLKLLHPGNGIRLRRQGICYFLIWYQALNGRSHPSSCCRYCLRLAARSRPTTPASSTSKRCSSTWRTLSSSSSGRTKPPTTTSASISCSSSSRCTICQGYVRRTTARLHCTGLT